MNLFIYDTKYLILNGICSYSRRPPNFFESCPLTSPKNMNGFTKKGINRKLLVETSLKSAGPRPT